MSQERIEYLRERLVAPDVQLAEVHEYLALNHQPLQGMVSQDYATFITEQDLSTFRWLFNWWAPVEDKPTTLPTPSIMQWCWNVNHAPGAPPVTFDMSMRNFYDRAINYCQLKDLNPEEPGESKEDRTRRINAKRMRDTRAHKKVPDKKLKGDPALSAQVRGLEEQVRALKAESKAEEDRLHAEVLEHQALMNDASRRKRESIADYKARIGVLVEQISTLTSSK